MKIFELAPDEHRWTQITIKVVLGVLLVARLCVAADTAAEHIRNFGVVDAHLYRGGALTDADLPELKALGVRLVVDLREDDKSGALEKEKLRQLGIDYARVPMRELGAPRPGEIERALSLLLRDPAEKIYVHCRRGKDRTGTVIACYRIQHDGWDNQRALEEAKAYGMSHLERAMQAFILHFTPLPLSSLTP